MKPIGSRSPGHPLPDSTLLDEEDLRRERNRARQLRSSQWWKNRRAQGRCHYCGKQFPPRDLTMDHIVPLVRGGKSVKANLVPCCKPCNQLKEDQLPSEWQAYLDHLADQDVDSGRQHSPESAG